MSNAGYDIAVPGNHEFDYTVPRFLELAENSSVPFLSANFMKKEDSSLLFDSYKIIEINPRLSAGAIFTCMAGLNMVTNAMKIADGEMCEIGDISVGAHFAERYEAYRMD